MGIREMSVRPAMPEDAKVLWESHVQSIRGLCSKDYAPEVIEAWSAIRFSPEHWTRTIAQDRVWALDCEGKTVGFCHVQLQADHWGEIVGLYIAPEGSGRGGGRRLMEAALAFLRLNGVKRIRLDGTLTARRFYEKFGFRRVGDSKFVERRGQKVECVPMERELL